jgi:hypothetical protein
LTKTVDMKSWHSWQDLSVSTATELFIHSDKRHELWPPTNLWYLVVTLLLQWAPTEV